MYSGQGDQQKSLQYYEKALKIHEEMGNREGIANDLGNMGICIPDTGRPQKSLQHYEKALKIHEEIGNRQGIANELGNMGMYSRYRAISKITPTL